MLGSHFKVYTDHQTLKNFDTQKDLSHRQARWMEHLSQFGMSISYICGEDNMVADALSRLPTETPEDLFMDVDVAHLPLRWDCWLKQPTSCNAILMITADQSFLNDVREGYKHNKFCKKLTDITGSMPGVHMINNLWYLGDHLVVPRHGQP